jgi:hypothetical protein
LLKFAIGIEGDAVMRSFQISEGIDVVSGFPAQSRRDGPRIELPDGTRSWQEV